MKTRTIKQTVTFKATPHEVYQALMDAKEHAAFTGGSAKINPAVGGAFSVFDGYARGKNLELKEDKKIVQAWQAQEDGWPEDYFSKLTIELREVKGGTELRMTHSGVPQEHADAVADGWHQYYWEPLKRMLE